MSDRVGSFTELGVRSTGDILRDVVRDVQDLLHSEVRLVKAEVSEQAGRARSSGGFIGGAVVTGLLASMCFAAACIALLAMAIPIWAGAMIMAFLLGGAAGVLSARAKDKLRKFRAVPEQTVGSIKDDVAWLKQRTR
jgi:Putative Actinobacterial Holin-X, holin superfamily III